MAQPPAVKPAYILLISVLILGAISLVIASALLLLGISGTKTVISLEQGAKARYLANACAEEALEQIRSSTTYVGVVNLTYSEGTCSYTVTNTGGSTREIRVISTAYSNTQRLLINLSSLSPQLTVSSWKEVADF
jgi:hypothetical protein